MIVLQGGETSIEGRLPYLQKGIVNILSQATGGIGVILEHRYYGTSFPTPDLSTENLRFLTTDQALADQVYFSENIVFPGLEHLNLTAPGTAHIAYGGSYAGAFVAFLRKLYPETYWGAISSSGVTEAYYDFWQYYEPVRQYAPQDCIDKHTKMINVADTILLAGYNGTIDTLKSAFNATGFTYNDDFANTLGYVMGYWQSRNWDPEVNDPTFYEYCGNITSTEDIYNLSSSDTSTVQQLITTGGWGNESSTLTPAMLNFIGWYQANILSVCDGESLDDCYGTHNASSSNYADKDVSNYDYLSWPYQYCTQWGYLQSGSTVPQDRLPLISRLITLAWNMQVCNYAFNITEPAKVEEINKYGAYTISYPRLAIVGGQADPWRSVTPLADYALDGSGPTEINKTSTHSEPIIVIAGAVHHWDENGLFANETTADLPPQPIKDAQAEEVAAVQSWMREWRMYCARNRGKCNNVEGSGWGEW